MRGFITAGLLLTSILLVSCEDDKWKWKDNKRSNARYSIHEDDVEFFNERPGPGFLGPNRPGFGGPQPDYRPQPGYRPQPDFRPQPGFIGDRPDYGSGGYGGAIRPPIDQFPIGGPQRPPVRRFDTCTCTEKFNCQSPGLSYGHCDVGKSYCCFNKHGGLDLGPAPSKNTHHPENGILVGPGAGVGGKPGFGRPGRPDPGYGGIREPGYNGIREPGFGGIREPGYGHGGIGGQGLLVGPGGPTGIIGRPGSRPSYSLNNGLLVGPGGPRDGPYGPNYYKKSSN